MAPDDTYTHGHHESVLRSHTWRTIENSAAYLLPHPSAGLDVLDVGCGPGTITVDLARRVAPGAVVGIDRSDEVVDVARRQAEGVHRVRFGSWADRMGDSSVADQAVRGGHCTRADLEDMADAFTEWAAHPDGWFAVLHGEVLARDERRVGRQRSPTRRRPLRRRARG